MRGQSTMGVSYGRARIADLAFHLFHRSLHPEWLSIRRHLRLALGDWQADVRIIEGGHSIVFGSNAFELTEVLAGPETPLPEPGLLYHSPIRNERSTSLRPGGVRSITRPASRSSASTPRSSATSARK